VEKKRATTGKTDTALRINPTGGKGGVIKLEMMILDFSSGRLGGSDEKRDDGGGTGGEKET